MTEIFTDRIGTNRYAPAGSDAVNLYRTSEFGEQFTLGQLIAAVSIRTAASLEARAVIDLNRLSVSTEYATALSNAVQMLTNDSDDENAVTWTMAVTLPEGYQTKSAQFAAENTLKNFFVYECGIDAAKLPADLKTLKNRLDAYAQVKDVMENVTRTSQMQQIEVQTSISRRDVALASSANVIKALGQSAMFTAQSLKM